MHAEAFTYVADQVGRLELDGGDVLDLGGREVNGSIRGLFPKATQYITVDIELHPSVDYVCDAADLDLGEWFDVVVSTECFEHTERAPEIVAAAFRHLRRQAWFVATMAGPGREPHSACGGPDVGDEFYRNVESADLDRWLLDAGFEWWNVDVLGADVRCIALKG